MIDRNDYGFFTKSQGLQVIDNNHKDNVFPMLVGAGIVLAIILLIGSCAHAQLKPAVNLQRIKMIESNGFPFAIGKAGEIGLYQIMPGTLKEYNQYNKKNIMQWQLFLPWVNKEVASWYLEKRIPQMIRYYGKPVTTRNIIISYNAGINYVKTGKAIPKRTRKYLRDYFKEVRG